MARLSRNRGVRFLTLRLEPRYHGRSIAQVGVVKALAMLQIFQYIVYLSHGLEKASAMDNDFVIEDSCKQRFDNLELYLNGGRLALEAVADSIDGSLDQGWDGFGALFG
ncbi:hypothetical protein HG530_000722 [Fusarium avenaceum]|nr:hypothetical protein HG530_000722 [Fusarium avenaceum]